jgi:molybdate transport system substrate-binding protein
MNKCWGAAVLLLALLSTACGGAPQGQTPQPQKVELNVSAAMGLKEVLVDIQKDYEALHPNVKIVYNLAASGVLQSQIEQGAPADIFISAAGKQLDDLQRKNLINSATRRDLVGNELVLIVPKDSTLELASFADLVKDGVKKFGLGAPETVPAGQYGIQVLQAMGIWEDVKSKAVLAKDVRTIVAYAETGNVEAGIVFSTVAATSDKVKVVAAAPPGTHEPILFPAVVVTSAKQPKAAEDFLNYLAGPDGMKVFKKYGFKPIQQ